MNYVMHANLRNSVLEFAAQGSLLRRSPLPTPPPPLPGGVELPANGASLWCNHLEFIWIPYSTSFNIWKTGKSNTHSCHCSMLSSSFGLLFPGLGQELQKTTLGIGQVPNGFRCLATCSWSLLFRHTTAEQKRPFWSILPILIRERIETVSEGNIPRMAELENLKDPLTCGIVDGSSELACNPSSWFKPFQRQEGRCTIYSVFTNHQIQTASKLNESLWR